jgi:hypothetical protein
MKTPEEILKQHAPGIILFGAGDGSVHKWNAVIKAMEEYAIQSVETATENAVHQLEMKQELLDQERELVRTLEEENLSLRNGYDDLKKEIKLKHTELTILEDTTGLTEYGKGQLSFCNTLMKL